MVKPGPPHFIFTQNISKPMRCIVYEKCMEIEIMYYYIDIESDYYHSAAQGGGGSVTDRKPIGEVSCCDARIAEAAH